MLKSRRIMLDNTHNNALEQLTKEFNTTPSFIIEALLNAYIKNGLSIQSIDHINDKKAEFNLREKRGFTPSEKITRK